MNATLTAVFETRHQPTIEAFRRFVTGELEPLWEEFGESTPEHIPQDVKRHVRRRSAELGFYGAEFPEAVGGRGLPLTAMAVLRHLAGSSGCPLAPLALPGPEGPTPLLAHGTPEQQQRYLVPLVRAEKMRSLGLTEPLAGSDAYHLATRARRSGTDWVLNGHKIFLSNLEVVDFVLVFAATDEHGGPNSTAVFIVDIDTPGLSVRQSFQGMAGELLYELLLDDVTLPADAVLGGPDQAHLAVAHGMLSLPRGRVLTAADCNGLAEYALNLGLEHARRRVAFGRPIGTFQHVQEHLVSTRTELAASKLLTLACTHQADERKELTSEDAAMAKITATELLKRAVDHSLQVLGGRGWMKGHPLEYLYRYARMMPIVGGTTEIQKVIIAHALGLGSLAQGPAPGIPARREEERLLPEGAV
ncbi:acyl-CoA dehydrogenase family protein [Streptomyces sp. CB02923]|uniref:acyl-CoA dehydrogenase family protein n=1 Tax=Streptomyces sp. CB02923 TaxID=1718985 RepID=UPI00093CA021|nr:acyl-CoA dehydrogenase family protein [Streptomyces sp. CB02923]